MINAVETNETKVMSPRTARALARLRDTSGKLVGSVFFGKLLETMRKSTLKGKYGHGGRGEEIFAAQLDGVIAERLGSADRSALSRLISKSLEHQQRLIVEQRTATVGRGRVSQGVDRV